MQFRKFIALATAVLFLGACSTTAKLHSYSGGKANQNTVVYISKEDLAKNHLEVGSLAEAMFPVKVEVGKELKNFSENYLSPVKEMPAGESMPPGIYISLNKFHIITERHFPRAATYNAELVLDVIVKDGNGKDVLSKTYSGNGGTETYSSVNSILVRGTASTSSGAFNEVFQKIASDVDAM